MIDGPLGESRVPSVEAKLRLLKKAGLLALCLYILQSVTIAYILSENLPKRLSYDKGDRGALARYLSAREALVEQFIRERLDTPVNDRRTLAMDLKAWVNSGDYIIFSDEVSRRANSLKEREYFAKLRRQKMVLWEAESAQLDKNWPGLRRSWSSFFSENYRELMALSP